MEIQPNLIYDIGMHLGRDTEFYLKKGFEVIAVEANPKLVKTAQEKFKPEIELGQLTIIDKAISETSNNIIDFYISSSKNDWGTTLPEWNRSMTNDFEKISVETICLEEIISNYGLPYYMKIDIEGADIICLKSLLNIRTSPTYVSIELLTPNNLVNETSDALKILCYLAVLGYRKFKVSDQSKNYLIKCPYPASEGQYVNFTFDGSSSGLFGKEHSGPSYTIDEVSIKYLKYFYPCSENNLIEKIKQKLNLKTRKEKQMYPFHSAGWFDIHAEKG